MPATDALDIVILAAGKGTRMRSSLAKVLHPVGGKPLLGHVIDTASAIGPRSINVVIGHQGADVQAAFADRQINWVEQAEQLGTGHAVGEANKTLNGDGVVLVLYGDVPLVTEATMRAAAEAAIAGHVGLVTSEFSDAAELGRIVREGGTIKSIVEYKDADESQRAITEINSGIMAIPADELSRWLKEIKPNNAQAELYLTDVIAMAVAEDKDVIGISAEETEVIGINDRTQLAEVERLYQARATQGLMLTGVSMADPSRVEIRGDVTAGEDCFIDINVVLAGKVSLGKNVTIGPGCVVQNSIIGDNTVLHPHTLVDGAKVAANCALGPFARIRPETVLGDGVKIGNFVETKKSTLGAGTKASHLAYLGDATLGENCNVGAGAITANYDGVNKFETRAGDNVFVGTNVTMVAPLQLEDWAFLAAGSTVIKNVGNNELAVGRGKQRNIPDWKRPDQQAAEPKDADET